MNCTKLGNIKPLILKSTIFYAWYFELNQAVGTLSCIFGKIERQKLFPKKKLEILTLYSRACTTCLKAKNTADRNSGCTPPSQDLLKE